MQEQDFTRTRIAPTPSGFVHEGNILSFLITSELARRSGARILLRIDDLDQERVRKEYVQDIFDVLHFMEIEWHEGPRDYQDYKKNHSQAQRAGLYQRAMKELEERQLVFACSCSRSSAGTVYSGRCAGKGLPLDTAGTKWRIKHHPSTIPVNTWQGPHTVPYPDEQRHFVVRKKDGNAAYQLASMIDDIHFGVDLIVRGADLWTSTLAQLSLSQQLGMKKFGSTVFYHHPLLGDAEGKKLSKSAGARAVKSLRDHYGTRTGVYKRLAVMLGCKGEPRSASELFDLVGAARFNSGGVPPNPH